MEGLAITTGVVSLGNLALSLARDLNNFIRRTRNVNQTIRGLHDEMGEIERICRLVERYVTSVRSSTFQDDELFNSIEAQLSSCTRALETVRSKITSAAAEEEESNPVVRVYRQIRLDMSDEEIQECRSRIQTSINNLQLILSLLHLLATHIVPQTAGQILPQTLEQIQEQSNRNGIDVRLRIRAEEYVRRGSTLYDSSVRGEHQAHRPEAVERWMGQINSLLSRVDPEEPPRDDESDKPDDEITATQTTLVDPNLRDEETQVAIDLVNTALASSKNKYKKGDYYGAETNFHECLDLMGFLPQQERHEETITEVHLHLALCTYHLYAPTIAETALLSVLSKAVVTRSHKLMQFKVSMAMSRTYIRMGKLEPARFNCDNAYIGRRKLLGREHDLCYESLALLAYIYDLQGQRARATTYRDMIPAHKRGEFGREHDQFTREYDRLRMGWWGKFKERAVEGTESLCGIIDGCFCLISESNTRRR